MAEVAFRKRTQPGRLEAEGETTERRWAIDVMGDREADEENASKLLLLLLHLLFVREETAAASAGTSKETKSNRNRAARPQLLQRGDRRESIDSNL